MLKRYKIYKENIMKDFDAFSFKAQSERKQSQSVHSIQEEQPKVVQPPRNWRQMTYRFEKNSLSKQIKYPTFQSNFINEKINRIDQQLTQNIRRRIQLQKKLYKQKQQVRQLQNQKFFKQDYNKSELQATELFVNMQKKSHAIQTLLNRQGNQFQKNKSGAKEKYLQNLQQQQTKKQRFILTRKPEQKKYIVPEQIKIQKLLRIATFPQLPKQNLQILQKRCLDMIKLSQHSDLYYIMMVLSFHLQKYHNVRKYFRQIQMYKVFQPKAYWIACQCQFQLQSYDICLKLAQICMKQLADQYLPRFVFLQARCYEKLGNHINSIVCYNQMIKMKPKIAQLYLQRALIYDKIGYPHEAKLDYIQFSTLEPKARQYLREKIMLQSNQIKRKQLIKALAKIS